MYLLCKNAPGEAKFCVIGAVYHFLLCVKGEDAGHSPKDLLPGNTHVVRHIDHNTGGEVVATGEGRVWHLHLLSSAQELGSLGNIQLLDYSTGIL